MLFVNGVAYSHYLPVGVPLVNGVLLINENIGEWGIIDYF